MNRQTPAMFVPEIAPWEVWARLRDCRFQADNSGGSHNSICFGGRRWAAYLRRKERANSFRNRESSFFLIITQVKHNRYQRASYDHPFNGRRFG